MERDLEEVRNYIRYESGKRLLRLTVNKIKVIKTIIYGESSFELIKKGVFK